MKIFFKYLQILLLIIGTVLVIYGIGLVKYKIWRAEHPYAETWTFFVPDKR